MFETDTSILVIETSALTFELQAIKMNQVYVHLHIQDLVWIYLKLSNVAHPYELQCTSIGLNSVWLI